MDLNTHLSKPESPWSLNPQVGNHRPLPSMAINMPVYISISETFEISESHFYTAMNIGDNCESEYSKYKIILTHFKEKLSIRGKHYCSFHQSK